VPSFPSRFPVFALDRVLGTPHNLVTAVEVHNTPLARMASDHLPIKAHLDLKTAAQLLEEFNPSLLTSNSSSGS
jgi:endonuclease/exonuclease/phosphatase family metal-dependent hydrolase